MEAYALPAFRMLVWRLGILRLNNLFFSEMSQILNPYISLGIHFLVLVFSGKSLATDFQDSRSYPQPDLFPDA